VIRFDGVDIREIELPHLRRSIGVVLQDNFMFRGSVRENIAMGRPDASFEAIVQAAQAAGADEFIERLPQGYDTLLEENAGNLSGGQRQRLAIARALVIEPRLLVLDEPTSALDVSIQKQVLDLLQDLQARRGLSYLLITHDVAVVRAMAHTVLVMKDGAVMEAGSVEEVLTRPREAYTRELVEGVG
jgi:ATP-binding cassette subfamily B protein